MFFVDSKRKKIVFPGFKHKSLVEVLKEFPFVEDLLYPQGFELVVDNLYTVHVNSDNTIVTLVDLDNGSIGYYKKIDFPTKTKHANKFERRVKPTNTLKVPEKTVTTKEVNIINKPDGSIEVNLPPHIAPVCSTYTNTEREKEIISYTLELDSEI